MNKPSHKASTFAIYTSQHANQKLQKSLLFSTQFKNKKISPSLKLNLATAQNPTDLNADLIRESMTKIVTTEIPLAITAPKKNGGRSANINSCAINKHGTFRQFSASNPPLLLAANR